VIYNSASFSHSVTSKYHYFANRLLQKGCSKRICITFDTCKKITNLLCYNNPIKLDVVQYRILSYAALRPPRKGTGKNKNTAEKQIQSYAYAAEKPAYGSTTL